MTRKALTLFVVLTLGFIALAMSLNRASANRTSDQTLISEAVSSDGLWFDVDASLLQRTSVQRETKRGPN